MNFRQPLPDMTFDDLRVGDRFALGTHRYEREDMIAFASQADPMPFHLSDEGAAGHAVFEGMSASGWQTVCLMGKMINQLWTKTSVKGLAGAGVDEIRWYTPVYVGDELTFTMEITAIRAFASKPSQGIMTMRVVATKEDGSENAAMSILGVFQRDPQAPDPGTLPGSKGSV